MLQQMEDAARHRHAILRMTADQHQAYRQHRAQLERTRVSYMDAAAREQYLAQHAVNEQRHLQAMFVEEFARHRERRTAQERKRVADMSEEERVAHRSAAATRMRVCKVQP